MGRRYADGHIEQIMGLHLAKRSILEAWIRPSQTSADSRYHDTLSLIYS